MESKLIMSTGNFSSAWKTCQTYLDMINHILIATVTIYISFVSYGIGATPRTWHMWLCTIGYQFLMAEGMLSFYNTNAWFRQHGRRSRTHLHWILQVIGAVFSIVGCVIEYYDNTRHLRSIHSLLGFISLIFLFVSLLNGLSAMWASNLHRNFGWLKPVYNKSFHNVCGLLAFVIGMVSQGYGYDTGRIIRNVSKENRVILQYVTIVMIVLTSYAALRSLWSQIRLMFCRTT